MVPDPTFARAKREAGVIAPRIINIVAVVCDGKVCSLNECAGPMLLDINKMDSNDLANKTDKSPRHDTTMNPPKKWKV